MIFVKDFAPFEYLLSFGFDTRPMVIMERRTPDEAVSYEGFSAFLDRFEVEEAYAADNLPLKITRNSTLIAANSRRGCGNCYAISAHSLWWDAVDYCASIWPLRCTLITDMPNDELFLYYNGPSQRLDGGAIIRPNRDGTLSVIENNNMIAYGRRIRMSTDVAELLSHG